MLFRYKATTSEGELKEGTLEAASYEIALDALQRRNLIVVSLEDISKGSFFDREISFLTRVKQRDIVVLSRQLATLFEARMPALQSFKLLASETENPVLREKLFEIVEDIQGGSTISQALAKHPKVFSKFYVSLIKSGEESGKLEEVFGYLADYLERSYEMISRVTRSLIYPAFVLTAFIGVIVLMMTVVVPRLTDIIKQSNQAVPVYTKVVMGLSSFLSSYGVLLLILLAVSAIFLWRYSRTSTGRMYFSRLQLNFPYLGDLYKKLYVARIADNLQILISGGVNLVRSLEITADVVGNEVYKKILLEALKAVKGGASLSTSLTNYEEIPHLFVQMVNIGESTGNLTFILETLARFYKKEVDGRLDVLISLIEPALVVVLGIGVGLLLASILIPIYNIAMSV